MTRKLLPPLLLLLLMGLTPVPTVLGQPQTPAEQLAALASHVDAALAHVDAGSVADAQAEYQAFDDGWFAIEDGIADQAPDSYEAIEDAMADTRRALQADQVDPDRARAVLHTLRQQIDAWISPQVPISTLESEDASGM